VTPLPLAADDGLDLAEGLALSGLSFNELWLRQVSVGGIAGALEVEAYVLGVLHADRHSHDVIAQALNEHFLDVGQGYPINYWTNSTTTAAG
jgi:hypothetical protein